MDIDGAMMSGEDGGCWLRPTPEDYEAPVTDTVGSGFENKRNGVRPIRVWSNL